jgi:hypothetical protein
VIDWKVDMRDTTNVTRKPNVNRVAAIFATTVGLLALAGCGGGDPVAEAVAKADGACACDNFECTTDFIKWFNEMSITLERDFEAWGEDGYNAYLEQSLRAAECQNALR